MNLITNKVNTPNLLFAIIISIGMIAIIFITCSVKIPNSFKPVYRSNDHIGLENCPLTPPNRLGRIPVDLKEEALEVVEARLSLSLQPGGWFTPKECKANDRVAIIVPKRERHYMLPIFLKNLHAMLMKQQIEYGIYIAEQTLDQDFNKGALFNAAVIEALKMKDWDCFIFHDIDEIPFDDRNLYNCPPKEGPRHLAVAEDRFNYKLIYEDFYGGAIAYTTEQYKKINGFSNLFWNWGGEDNDLFERTKKAGLKHTRYSPAIAVYKSLKHRKSEKVNPKWSKNIKEFQKYFNVSGLNSLEYHIKEFKIKPTHVHIFIDHFTKEEPFKHPTSNSTSKPTSKPTSTQ